MNRAADASRPAYTARQGQFLAFIHAYTLMNGRPSAEADMMRFFRLTPPSVHQMVLTLERAGLISRQPGVRRSIVVLLDRSVLPELKPEYAQPVITSVQRYCLQVASTLWWPSDALGRTGHTTFARHRPTRRRGVSPSPGASP